MTIDNVDNWQEEYTSQGDKKTKINEIINNGNPAVIGTPTYSTIQHIQDIFHSAGWFSGGTITDAGSGNITVSTGTGAIRSANSRVGQLLFFDWGALGSTAIPSDTIRYIGVEYNDGSPQVVVRSSANWNFNIDFPLGTVVNESGTLHITQSEHAVGDHANFMIQRIQEINGIQRANQLGGLIIGEDGSNRYITITAGILWDGLKSFSISAIDTNPGGGADTFDRYYQDGGSGWTKEASQTTWNNTQYDDGDGGLATMTANFRSVQYFYLELDGTLVSIYGQAEYATVALAENDDPPSTLPDRLDPDHAILIGRIVFQKSASSGDPQTIFMATFETAGVTAHSDLSGIDVSDHHTKYTDGDTESVITAELVDGQSIDSAIDALIATHKALASDHHTKTINTGDLSAGTLPYVRGGTNNDLGSKTNDGLVYNSGGTQLDVTDLTTTQLKDLLMFGSSNQAWVPCPFESTGSSYASIEAGSGGIYNVGTSGVDFNLQFRFPLPLTKGTLDFYVTSLKVILDYGAVGTDYVDTAYIIGADPSAYHAIIHRTLITNLDAEGSWEANNATTMTNGAGAGFSAINTSTNLTLAVHLSFIISTTSDQILIRGVFLKGYYA